MFGKVLTLGGRAAAALTGAAAALLAAASPATAAIVYRFDFYEMIQFEPLQPVPDFSLTIEKPDYLTVTGLNPLPSPLATPLGYDVATFGTNIHKWFLFANTGGFLSDDSAFFSVTTFLFEPLTAPGAATGYITAPGVRGILSGNVEGSGVFGNATLTVADTAVPEPSSWALMIAGFGLAGAGLRRAASRRGKAQIIATNPSPAPTRSTSPA